MNKIIKFIKAKKVFLKPKKAKYLILDGVNSFIFKKYLNNKNVNVLYTRFENINIYILFKIFLKLRFSFNDYIIEYIKHVSCEKIICFYDNIIFYYKLKNIFPHLKIIIIQNGMRPEFFFKELKNHNNLKVDYLLTFNENYSKKFRRHIKGKLISIGSFKNNLIVRKNYLNKNFVSYISSGPFTSKNEINIYKNKRISKSIYYTPERILIPKIYSFCVRHNLILRVISRSKSEGPALIEKEFYDNILGQNKYKFIKAFNFKDAYKLSDSSVININIYSAFGLECLSRGNKTLIFNVRDKITKLKSLKIFWLEKKVPKKGLFWTNEINDSEVNRLMKFALYSKKDEWYQALNIINPILLKYDRDNKIFKKLL